MYIIGITGMIASGKTSVSKLYKEMGAYLLDADKIGHELLLNQNIKKQISDTFGREVLDNNGEIDRHKLSEIVFNSEEKLELLNQITEKPIVSVIRENIMELEEVGFPGIVVIDAAILPRWELVKSIDLIILVESPKWQLMNRLVRQKGFTQDEAKIRIGIQEPMFKNFHPTHSLVIKNNGDFVEMRTNAMNIWMQIKQLAREKEQ